MTRPVLALVIGAAAIAAVIVADCAWRHGLFRSHGGGHARAVPAPVRESRNANRITAWWQRLTRDDGWDHGLDDQDIADVFGAQDVPRRGGMMEVPEVRKPDVPVHAVKPCTAPGDHGAWRETAEREGRALHGLNHAQNVPRPRELRHSGDGRPEQDNGPGHPCPNCGRPGFDGICGHCGSGYGYQPRLASGTPEARVVAVWNPGERPPLAGDRVSGTLSDDTDILTPFRVCREVRRPETACLAMLRQHYAGAGIPPSMDYVQHALTAPLGQVLALAP